MQPRNLAGSHWFPAEKNKWDDDDDEEEEDDDDDEDEDSPILYGNPP